MTGCRDSTSAATLTSSSRSSCPSCWPTPPGWKPYQNDHEDANGQFQELRIHAWCYGLKDGLLNDLGFTARDPADVRNGYDNAVAAVKLRYKGG